MKYFESKHFHRGSLETYRRPSELRGKYHMLIVMCIFGLMIIAFSTYLYIYFYDSNHPPIHIKADARPFKIRAIKTVVTHDLHSDKTIYSELVGESNPLKNENLLNQTERPQIQYPSLTDEFMHALENDEDTLNHLKTNPSPALNLSDLVSKVYNNSDLTVDVEEDTTDMLISQNLEPDKRSEPVTAAQPSIFITENSNLKQPKVFISETPSHTDMQTAEMIVKSSKLSNSSQNKTIKNLKDTQVRVYVGDAHTHEQAQKYWTKAQTQNPQILKHLKSYIQRVDLGANIGIRYHISLGLLNTNKAKNLCQQLRRNKVKCWISH